MSANSSDERDRVTTYTYAPDDVVGGPVTWTIYGADGRVVVRGSGPTPDGLLAAPDPTDPRDGDAPDEPHVTG